MIQKKKLLVIEDEKDICRLIEFNLKKEGYDMVSIHRGDEAMDRVRSYRPDLVILDLMIPGLDGFEVCRRLKNSDDTKTIPILMLTAKADDANIVAGLELGADDYMSKPFSVSVLIARIRLALRRNREETLPKSRALVFGDLRVYSEEVRVDIGNETLSLTPSEFKILDFLAHAPERVWSRNQIIDTVRGENHIVTDRVVDVMIAGLRRKMGVYGKCIQTVRGVGYRFSAPRS